MRNHIYVKSKNEPPHDKTNKMTYAPSEDSYQSGHPPSLIRVFAVCMRKPWVLSYPLSAYQILRSDWVYAQADMSLRWAHRSFCWFCHGAAQMLMQSKQANLYVTGAPMVITTELVSPQCYHCIKNPIHPHPKIYRNMACLGNDVHWLHGR